MDKRKLDLITWGFVILTAVIVALMLMSNLRRSSRVILPDTDTTQEDSAHLPTEGDDLTVVDVTPETVQTAVATLARPESYSRSIIVEHLWTGGSQTAEVTAAVRDGWTRTDRTLPDGQVRHVLTDGTQTYIWYNDETTLYAGPAGTITADMEQNVPTYEEVLALDTAAITAADYRTVSDVRCIYLETEADAWGYVQRYWVSVDTGLLVVAERSQDGETVYRMAALTVDTSVPPETLFILPDGTALLQTAP